MNQIKQPPEGRLLQQARERRDWSIRSAASRTGISEGRWRQNEVATNGVPAARSGQMNVKRWSETWLPVYQQKVRPTRYTDVRGVVNRYIVPSIGNRKLSALTPADVRAVHKATEDAGYGTATTLRTHDALMVMLKDAQREGVAIPANVMLVRRPKLAESDRDAVPPDDTAAILEVAMGRPDAARWVCAFLQGMRQGECLGLTWECVDLDAGLLDISWQLQALPYADRAAGVFRVPRAYTHRQLVGQMHLVRPKSKSGTRVIPLIPVVRDLFIEWQRTSPPNEHGLVWTEQGRPVRKVTDRAAWFGIQDAAQVARVDGTAGRRYTLHEARHTTATLLLEAGVNEHTVVQILGHSKITTSRGYQHVSRVLMQQAMERVAERLQLAP